MAVEEKDDVYERILDGWCAEPHLRHLSRAEVKARYPAYVFPGTRDYLAVTGEVSRQCYMANWRPTNWPPKTSETADTLPPIQRPKFGREEFALLEATVAKYDGSDEDKKKAGTLLLWSATVFRAAEEKWRGCEQAMEKLLNMYDEYPTAGTLASRAITEFTETRVSAADRKRIHESGERREALRMLDKMTLEKMMRK
jgi:hypothetical protein